MHSVPQSLFHANSLQKTHQSALQVQQKAEMLLQTGHFDPEAIRGCAEKVAVYWQQLMMKMEDRLKLVNASVAFYKTSEQVRPRTLPPAGQRGCHQVRSIMWGQPALNKHNVWCMAVHNRQLYLFV